MKPPDEVFCMGCDPGTILDADPRAHRLRERPAWRASSTEAKIIEHQRFAACLRARITPSFDTRTAGAAEVADRVAARVQPLLPVTQAPGG